MSRKPSPVLGPAGPGRVCEYVCGWGRGQSGAEEAVGAQVGGRLPDPAAPPPSRLQNQALSLRLTELQQLVDDYELQREVRCQGREGAAPPNCLRSTPLV